MKKKKNYWTTQLKCVRHIWSRSNPERKECLMKAKLITEEGLQKWKCACCDNCFALSEVEVDHIEAIENTVPKNVEEFLNSFHRLHSSNLQILCKKCHKLKTREDLFKKKYTESLIRVSLHMQMFPAFVMNNIKDWKVLQSFDKIVSKINKSTDDKKMKKYENKLDKLKEKYL